MIFSNLLLASESYILSELEINSSKLCLPWPGWSTDMNSLLTKNANFCFDFYWCNLCVYRLAFISLWCSQHGGFSSIYNSLTFATMILSDLIQFLLWMIRLSSEIFLSQIFNFYLQRNEKFYVFSRFIYLNLALHVSQLFQCFSVLNTDYCSFSGWNVLVVVDSKSRVDSELIRVVSVVSNFLKPKP